MNEDNETKQILNRLMVVFNVSTDSALSTFINTPARTISTWRTRNTPPYDLCVSIAKEKNLNLNWLLMNEGEMRKTQLTNALQETPPNYEVKPTSLNRRVQMMAKIMEALPEKQQDKILSAAEDAERLVHLEQQITQITQRLSA